MEFIIFWVITSLILVIGGGALLFLIAATDRSPQQGIAGRMASRKAREAEQYMYSEGIPIILLWVFGVPFAILLFFISKVTGLSPFAICSTVVIIALIIFIVFVVWVFAVGMKYLLEECRK